MIQVQLKLKPTKAQQAVLAEWLNILTGVWNWAITKIGNDAADHIYHTQFDFRNILAHHNDRLGMPSHTIQAQLNIAYIAWKRCFKKISRKPRLKTKLTMVKSIPFPDPVGPKNISPTKVKLPTIGELAFYKQPIPAGKVKCASILRKASGWYVALFIDADREPINYDKKKPVIAIYLGARSQIAMFDGEKQTMIEKPHYFEAKEKRLGQAQRGINKRLVARLHERVKNKRKDFDHKLSHKLVKEYSKIIVNKDSLQSAARKQGKLVAENSYYQLRMMLAYKASVSNVEFIEVDLQDSTGLCSRCGVVTGPTGGARLSVRNWECEGCGARHETGGNAARNILTSGAGAVHERPRKKGRPKH